MGLLPLDTPIQPQQHRPTQGSARSGLLHAEQREKKKRGFPKSDFEQGD